MRSQGWPLAPGRQSFEDQSFEDKRSTNQDQDWRPARAAQQERLAAGAQPAEPASGRLVGVLRLRRLQAYKAVDHHAMIAFAASPTLLLPRFAANILRNPAQKNS
jgi:hypothetical protein